LFLAASIGPIECSNPVSTDVCQRTYTLAQNISQRNASAMAITHTGQCPPLKLLLFSSAADTDRADHPLHATINDICAADIDFRTRCHSMTGRCHRRGRVNPINTTLFLPGKRLGVKGFNHLAAESVWLVCWTYFGGRSAEDRGDEYDPFSFKHDATIFLRR
ncbi:hypothetical protein BGW80DRAFT_1274197, partial [Lactifluus volemus]